MLLFWFWLHTSASRFACSCVLLLFDVTGTRPLLLHSTCAQGTYMGQGREAQVQADLAADLAGRLLAVPSLTGALPLPQGSCRHMMHSAPARLLQSLLHQWLPHAAPGHLGTAGRLPLMLLLLQISPRCCHALERVIQRGC
jgi:hypothetical protein